MSMEERKISWVVEGLIWGMLMFVIMGLIYPFIVDESYGLKGIAFNLLIWSLGGLAYGFTMDWIRRRQTSKS